VTSPLSVDAQKDGIKTQSETNNPQKQSKMLWFIALYVGGVIVVASVSYTLRLLVV